MAGNGRYGGGSAGSEDRYHYPAVDCAQFGEVGQGNFDTAPEHRGGTTKLAAAETGTMAGGRGTCMGASYGEDKWRDGFRA